jgi:LmbE family N-acetylglucosaminyl deacetylase
MIAAERWLVIAPHPDDELLGCGGTLALAAARGARVEVLVVCDGAAGDPERKFEAQGYVARRRAEARAGGALLGVERYTFWGLPEGHAPTPREIEVGAARLGRFVLAGRPDLLLAPWSGDAHLDHQSVSHAVRRMLELLPRGGQRLEAWAFEVWSPLAAQHLVDVSSVWPAKLAALEQHATQLAYADLAARATASARRHAAGLHEAFARFEVAR